MSEKKAGQKRCEQARKSAECRALLGQRDFSNVVQAKIGITIRNAALEVPLAC
jgi:hypothetical protein